MLVTCSGTGAVVQRAMWGSPGGREMEGTNDCTVGRRQRPDIAHKASVKTKCTGLQEISTGLRNQSMVCLRFGYVLDHIVLFRSFCVNAVCHAKSMSC